MLQAVNRAVCYVVDRGIVGKEVIVMEDQKLDIYNIDTDQWRTGPATTAVSKYFPPLCT